MQFRPCGGTISDVIWSFHQGIGECVSKGKNSMGAFS